MTRQNKSNRPSKRARKPRFRPFKVGQVVYWIGDAYVVIRGVLRPRFYDEECTYEIQTTTSSRLIDAAPDELRPLTKTEKGEGGRRGK